MAWDKGDITTDITSQLHAQGGPKANKIQASTELTEGDDTLKNPVFLVTGLVFLQLTIGALMRHTQSGLAITDFPLAGGYYFPPFNQAMLNALQSIQFESGLPLANMNQVLIHFLHRIMAVAVGCAAGWLSLKVFKKYKNNTKDCFFCQRSKTFLPLPKTTLCTDLSPLFSRYKQPNYAMLYTIRTVFTSSIRFFQNISI